MTYLRDANGMPYATVQGTPVTVTVTNTPRPGEPAGARDRSPGYNETPAIRLAEQLQQVRDEWLANHEKTCAPRKPPTGLPIDAAARKAMPVMTGVLDYFPDAIAAVAQVSHIGNDQHNPGKPVYWRRGASTDHDDCAIRHFMERGTPDSDGGRHTAKAAWRVLARLQMEIEAERAGMTYSDYIAKVQREES